MASILEKIVIVGFGWVGQANGLALSLMGYDVSYYDLTIPTLHYKDVYGRFYEKIKGLSNLKEIDSPHTSYVVCVGDRVSEAGEQDVSLIEKVLTSLKGVKGQVILRSTVLPQNLSKLSFDFYIPEFLHEIRAVEECVKPPFFVIGEKTHSVEEPSFVREWVEKTKRVFRGTPEEASYVKYLSNLWNATRIAFVNEFGDLVGEPLDEAARARAERITDFVLERKSYLKYGRAFGGHCLPKDTRAFVGAHPKSVLIRAAYAANTDHRKLEEKYKTLPEWFSFWEHDEAGMIRDTSWPTFLLGKLRSYRWFCVLSQTLRPSLFKLETFLPTRSMEALRGQWDKRAGENARYFVDTKAYQGRDVTEFEVRDSGKAAVEALLVKDDLLKQHLGDFKKKKLLEIGVGIGRMTEFLADHFKEVYGVDISPRMIEIARARLSGIRNVTVALSDGLTLPVAAGEYDIVVSYAALQYLPRVEFLKDVLKDIHRVLKGGGVAKIQLRTGPKLHKWAPWYGVTLAPHEAMSLAEEAGFKVLKSEVVETKKLWLWLSK